MGRGVDTSIQQSNSGRKSSIDVRQYYTYAYRCLREGVGPCGLSSLEAVIEQCAYESFEQRQRDLTGWKDFGRFIDWRMLAYQKGVGEYPLPF